MRALSVDPGLRHMALCCCDDTNAISLWTVLDVPRTPKEFASALRNLVRDLEYDAVVIERQPPRNAAAKKVEHWLELLFGETHPVHVVNAQFKNVRGATYRQRKKASVDAARSAMPDAWRDMFEQAPKRDDLADAYVQARAFLKLS